MNYSRSVSALLLVLVFSAGLCTGKTPRQPSPSPFTPRVKKQGSVFRQIAMGLAFGVIITSSVLIPIVFYYCCFCCKKIYNVWHGYRPDIVLKISRRSQAVPSHQTVYRPFAMHQQPQPVPLNGTQSSITTV
ncbi:uncharacterized protein LOC118199396 [Stegodyphus dumicola]|uniref:uncharacterized protein LOC118199396 n=1 Tax=Stegodyphus dumicola TaxID=202533 RepID=UPI0015AA8967|nr:uncharacterized protein LOC118199396 [Stegodyphus dumicola]